MSREGTERSDVSDAVNPPDAFGGCPVCGGNDGFLIVGRAHWFMCNKHKTKWRIGDNWFRRWRWETEDIWQDNAKLLSEYQEVPFVTSREPKSDTRNAVIPREVLSALETIIEYLWDDERNDCRATDPECREGHVFSSLVAVRNWLDDDTRSIDWWFANA